MSTLYSISPCLCRLSWRIRHTSAWYPHTPTLVPAPGTTTPPQVPAPRSISNFVRVAPYQPISTSRSMLLRVAAFLGAYQVFGNLLHVQHLVPRMRGSAQSKRTFENVTRVSNSRLGISGRAAKKTGGKHTMPLLSDIMAAEPESNATDSSSWIA
eukprot:3083005-Rhodomonas_salina.1